MLPIQGQSDIATPAKQDGLHGVYKTINLMRKGLQRPVVFADLYCGSGINHAGGSEINGSPITMLSALHESIASMRGKPTCSRVVLFADIVSERVNDTLPLIVEQWQRTNGLPVNRNMLKCMTSDRQLVEIPIHYHAKSADQSLDDMSEAIKRGYHVVITIDPNGPKDAPWKKLREMYLTYWRRLEVVVHVSATALKRVAHARAATSINFAPMPDHIADMVSAFDGAGGWVREPVGADQWTLLLLSNYPPRNGWSPRNGGARFHRIDDLQGQDVIRRLSLTRKQLEQLK
jgi:three-Cys-motif partner protein